LRKPDKRHDNVYDVPQKYNDSIMSQTRIFHQGGITLSQILIKNERVVQERMKSAKFLLFLNGLTKNLALNPKQNLPKHSYSYVSEDFVLGNCSRRCSTSCVHAVAPSLPAFPSNPSP